jgi:hypothetical protein
MLPAMITSGERPARRITIRLRFAKDHAQQAALIAHVRARDDEQLRLSADMAEAVAAGSAGATALRDTELTILKNEIMGGAVMAKRKAKRGCTLEIVAVSGATAEGGIASVPSIAFAVATTLAMLQGLGVEDLREKPHGGYGWELAGVEVADAT